MVSILKIRTALAATLATLAAAQNSTFATTTSAAAWPTVNLFIDDDFDGHIGYAGSIISACADQTVYAIRCTSVTHSSIPGLGYATCGPDAEELTLTEGPSTYVLQTKTAGDVDGTQVALTVAESCALEGTTVATCTASISASADGTSTATTAVQTLTGAEYHRFDVAITAGAEKTAAATGTCEKQSGAGIVDARNVGMLGAVLGAGITGLFLL